eukprot:13542.XXX_121960_121718_1 [CDS] Oithona nana genome sequencing.
MHIIDFFFDVNLGAKQLTIIHIRFETSSKRLWHPGAMLLPTTSNYFFYCSSLSMSLHSY